MKKLFKNNLWFLALAALTFVVGFLLDENDSVRPAVIAERFEKRLHKSEIILENEFENFTTQPRGPSYYSDLYNNKGIVLLCYHGDSLIRWTGNAVAPETPQIFNTTRGIIKLPTGWFALRKKRTDSLTYVGLLLIKNNFPYQNAYLKNYFSGGMRIVKSAIVADIDSRKGLLIKDVQERDFCRLDIIDDSPAEPYNNIFTYFFYSLFVILLVTFLYNECEYYSKTIGKLWPSAVYISTLWVLRFLTLYLRFPENVYSSDLFGPKFFADANSLWLPSLGDFLLNSVLILYTTYYLSQKIKAGKKIENLNLVFKGLLTLAMFLIALRLAWEINTLFVGLIRNSNIPFNINNLFALSAQTYIALVILASMFWAFFFTTSIVIKIIEALKQKTSLTWLLLISSFAIHTAWCHLNGRLDLVSIMWAFPVMATLYITRKKITRSESYPFSAIVVLVFLFSVYSVHTFLKHNGLKEYDLRHAYADKLSDEKDPVAEYLFSETEKKLMADTVLNNILKTRPVNYVNVEKRILQNHLSGYWDKYDISISIFDSLCYPVLKSGLNSVDNNFHLDNLIESTAEQTVSESFFYVPNEGGKINYVARIPIRKLGAGNPHTTIYIDFKSRLATDEIGFPELLLDKSVTQNTELKNYSYAKYKNGELVNHYGKFGYPSKSNFYEIGNLKYAVKEYEGYSHVISHPDKNTVVVISKEITTHLDEVTTFSYLFAFNCLLLLLIISIRQLTYGKAHFKTISFKNKLQILLISIVLISLILFGSGTVYFINLQFDNKSKEVIAEKIRSVQIEVQNKLEGNNDKNFQYKEYVSYILKKFSNIFFTDITLYDKNGNLIASSSPKLFEENLLPTKMNYEAFCEMAISGKTEFIHSEKIGRLNYLSAYLPFTDKRGQVLGYLNLPYFAKQNELEKEISTFLVALINVYVLLFALTALIAIFFSNYLTRPLRIIQEKMSTLTLGKPNEFIEWEEKDEIGNLVSEYNRMIVELGKSAEMLARSERELAWREMAKQVAHEIKNPLTPMKLSIQHLKKIWKDKSPDIDQKVDSVTKMLIEQIDALTNIANEFSNFAKMPKANEEEINIKKILANVVELYNDSVKIILSDNCPDENSLVIADKEQLLRVFNNLVKNSIQAIPEEREGFIEIKISTKKGEYIIAIKDNGSGINEAAMDKIFMPNFTTKSTGMGLGLAMVKNIVENAQGKIWFETTKNVGTTFYVSLPKAKNE